MFSSVSRPLVASSKEALAHFEALLKFETDCLDEQHAQYSNRVVCCAEPHYNTIEKSAARLAKLNRPIKKVIGRIMVRLDDGFKVNND